MIDILQLAEKGLKKLKDGEVGINIDAKNRDDAEYLKSYFELKGYDAKIADSELKEGQDTVYPVNIFNQMLVGVNQNA